jgi:hypothetical protein
VHVVAKAPQRVCHTHTHTHARTRIQAHKGIQMTCTLTHAHSHSHMHTHTCTLTHAHSHMHNGPTQNECMPPATHAHARTTPEIRAPRAVVLAAGEEANYQAPFIDEATAEDLRPVRLQRGAQPRDKLVLRRLASVLTSQRHSQFTESHYRDYCCERVPFAF